MSVKQPPSYLVGFTAATVVLVIVAAVSVSYYYSSSADLAAKDQEILHMKAVMLSQNASSLLLQLQILELNSNITALNQRIAGLTQSQNVSNSEISSLVNQVGRLRNQSAFLSLELSVVKNAVGNPTYNAYFVNKTVSVAPGTTMLVTTQTTGRNGTLAFISPNGCQSPGDNIGTTYPTYQYYILLNSASTNYQTSSYHVVKAPAFSFYFQNVGTATVSCTFSLLYVGT